MLGFSKSDNWNENNLNPLSRINWRASLVPAAASPNVEKGYVVQQYAAPLYPPFYFTVYDNYGQYANISLSEKLVSLTIVESQCDGVNAYLTGADKVGFVDGRATFDNLVAYCSPNGRLKLQATFNFGDLIESLDFISLLSLQRDFVVNSTIILYFRECSAGESMTNGICVPCPATTYNLRPNSTRSDSCTSCVSTKGINSCEKNQIFVEDGYWRRYNTSEAVLKCLLGSGSCVSGNFAGQAACGKGYEGPLCAVCQSGYYLVSDRGICQNCQALKQDVTLFGIVSFGSVLVVIIVLVIWLYISNRAALKRFWSYIKREYEAIIVKVKIVVATYQVVISSADVFQVSYPAAFAKFLKSFDFLNLRFLSMTSFQCSYRSYNFTNELLWTTLIPIIFSFVILFTYLIHDWYCKREEKHLLSISAINREKLLDRYLNIFFYLTYLCLPSVTTTIFKIFLCTNVDPQREDYDEHD
jgi:hypothetical protein